MHLGREEFPECMYAVDALLDGSAIPEVYLGFASSTALLGRLALFSDVLIPSRCCAVWHHQPPGRREGAVVELVRRAMPAAQ